MRGSRRSLSPGLLSMVAALLLCAQLLPAAAPVKEHVLENGMRFLIIEDPTTPSFIGAWVAHVGAANEQAGATGLTHLLEHMMFKGTEIIGTNDLQKDLELIDRQEELKDEMRRMDRDFRWQVRRGQIDHLSEARDESAEYQKLIEEFQQLIEEQRENMIPNEFDQIMQKNGELFGNAFTNSDMTAYFNMLPSNKLELWFWMESDRLLNPVFREFYAERDVVREERRMRTESSPTGIHDEAVNASFWQAHPYHWPVIGWASDVENLSMKQAKDYFHTYYGPGNLTAIVAGDVKEKEVLKMAKKYFGRLESRVDPPALITLEPEQVGEKRYYGEADVNTTVHMMYHAGGFGHVDSPELQTLAELLSGDTGRLQRSLVQENKLAVNAWAYYDRSKYGGIFHLEAEAAEGVEHMALEVALEKELARLSNEIVDDRELQKIKNNYLVDVYREEQNPIRAAFGLIINSGLGDWREQERFRNAILESSTDELMEVAGRTFQPEKRLVSWWTRTAVEGEAAEADQPMPEGFSELPSEMQTMARGFIQRVQGTSDANQLMGLRMQMEGLPPEDENYAKLGQLLIGVLDQRLDEIKAEGEGK